MAAKKRRLYAAVEVMWPRRRLVGRLARTPWIDRRMRLLEYGEWWECATWVRTDTLERVNEERSRYDDYFVPDVKGPSWGPLPY